MDCSRIQFIPGPTKKEVAARIRGMKRVAEEALKTREGAIELLVSTGMYTKAGRIKKRFR
jgi:hypothetical protein